MNFSAKMICFIFAVAVQADLGHLNNEEKSKYLDNFKIEEPLELDITAALDAK